MRNREMKRLREWMSRLTPGQREELRAELGVADARPAVMTVIEGRAAGLATCPYCQGGQVSRYGTAKGQQRFRCRACCRVFTALTGSPLAGLHRRGKWLDHAAALREGLTLKQVAARLRMSIGTAHRWRHRFLAAPKALPAQRLAGIAEADETFFLHSRKGQRRDMDRPARRRGGKASTRGTAPDLVPVLVARDRAGQTADFILERANKLTIVAALQPKLAPDVILCTDGSSTLAAAAKAIGVEHHALNVAAGVRVDGPWHIQNINAYHSRLKGWMHRFRGVATKYLASYLGWFRTLDRTAASAPKPAQWLALSLG